MIHAYQLHTATPPTMHFQPSLPAVTDVLLRQFDHPDEMRKMIKGRFEIVRLVGRTIGRATYEPGWRWSEHVGPMLGEKRCHVEHLGLVLQGAATCAFENGQITVMRPGDLFYIPPIAHDSWVVGDEPYVSLHFLGADHYAAAPGSAD